MKVKRVN